MREVMKLGVFKANPLDTIQCHLKYTIDAQMKELDSLKK